MAKAGRIQHWKHGWIPISPEAKAYVAGHGPKPSVYSNTPNSSKGIPSAKVRDDIVRAQDRADEVEELMPELGRVEPFWQFSSQNMPAHHTGGIKLRPDQVESMINILERTHEGTSDYNDMRRNAGLSTRIPANRNKGSLEEMAIRWAKRIKLLLGLSFTPTPEYFKSPDNQFGGRKSGYTGGLVFPGSTTDEMIKALRMRHTGTPGPRESRRMAGLG